MFIPPNVKAFGPRATALRLLLQRRANLLEAIPAQVYGYAMAHWPMPGRTLYLVNNPEDARRVLSTEAALFPKAPEFAAALRPLVGDGVFVSNGDLWRRRRALTRPAFSHIALRGAFPHMAAATDAAEMRLDVLAQTGEMFDLGQVMSYLTADIIHRTMFSTPIDPERARTVFAAFDRLQHLSDQLLPRRFLRAKNSFEPSDRAALLVTAEKLRAVIGQHVDLRLSVVPGSMSAPQDMAQAIINSQDPETGARLSREALIDELAVFFLAGHETSASALSWAFLVSTQVPGVADSLFVEHHHARGELGTLSFEAAQEKLAFAGMVIREVLRLYPPVSFLVRTPTQPVRMRRWTLNPGDLVIISPWVLGRHQNLWKNPDAFDPCRWAEDCDDPKSKGAELAFGAGPRGCPGAAFASLEASLILSRLTARYRFRFAAPRRIRPAARLTVRPDRPLRCRVERR